MVYCSPTATEGQALNNKNEGGNMKRTLMAALIALAGIVQAAKVSSVTVKMSDGTDVNTGERI